MEARKLQRQRGMWVTIVLFNLFVVAMLGVLLRSKILFPIEICDFKYLLNAHSHFAFGAWISLSLMLLLVYEILPADRAGRPVYQWLFRSALVNSWGMLLSFPFQGYGFYSILFSSLFTLTTYVFCWVLIQDTLKSGPGKAVSILTVAALISLVLSSAGPIALAFLVSSHSGNALLSKDAIYTYLHLQYNGFFSLAVFALFIHRFGRSAGTAFQHIAERFAKTMALAVLPTLFLSYLWNYPNMYVRAIAFFGCVCLLLALSALIALIRKLGKEISGLPLVIKSLVFFSMLAFGMKIVMQCGTIFPAVGDLIFANRAIIIGYLHLVMLGFLSLYLMAHFCSMGILNVEHSLTKYAVMSFLFAVIANEAILMVQGIEAFFMMGSPKFQWYLWCAAIWIFLSALMIFISRLKFNETTSLESVQKENSF